MPTPSAPGIWTGPTIRAGPADSVAWTSSTVRNSTVITPYREPREARTRGATGNWYICIATSRKPNASLDRQRKAHLLMIFRIRAVSDLLEPCEAKVSSTVLRGGGGWRHLLSTRSVRVTSRPYPPSTKQGHSPRPSVQTLLTLACVPAQHN